MNNTDACARGYLLAAALGAAGGGLITILATRAIPKIMSQMMSEMMQNMAACIDEGECSPAEM
jgi:hypothetical protein